MDNNRKTLIGIQISDEGAQITWFDKSLKTPQTLSMSGAGEDGLIPVPADARKGLMRGGRFGMQSFSRFMKELIHSVPGEIREEDLCVCVTVPQLSAKLGEHLVECLTGMGIERRHIFLQDWRTSFYYYVVSQKRELWNGDVAFLREKNEQITGYILHIDRSVKPALVTIREIASADVSERSRAGRSVEAWNKERDHRLYELLGRMFERRTVTASFLYGTYFDRSWAERSFQYLTFRRHAFQGQNLFSQGACYSVMARMGYLRMPDLLFMGADMISRNIGMKLRIKGKEQYQMLIPAGTNWYEAHCRFDVIPDDETSITVITTPAEEGESVAHVLRLDHFPDRDRRATRLRLTIYFSAPERCEIEAEDLGFGGITPPGGRTWKRQVVL